MDRYPVPEYSVELFSRVACRKGRWFLENQLWSRYRSSQRILRPNVPGGVPSTNAAPLTAEDLKMGQGKILYDFRAL